MKLKKPRFVPWKGPPPFQYKRGENSQKGAQELIIHSFQDFVKWINPSFIPKRPFILSLVLQALAFNQFSIKTKRR